MWTCPSLFCGDKNMLGRLCCRRFCNFVAGLTDRNVDSTSTSLVRTGRRSERRVRRDFDPPNIVNAVASRTIRQIRLAAAFQPAATRIVPDLSIGNHLRSFRTAYFEVRANSRDLLRRVKLISKDAACRHRRRYWPGVVAMSVLTGKLATTRSRYGSATSPANSL